MTRITLFRGISAAVFDDPARGRSRALRLVV